MLQDIMKMLCSNHDWLRALRMASYGFLLYGPGSYTWYQYLDRALPKPTVENLLLKVFFLFLFLIFFPFIMVTLKGKSGFFKQCLKFTPFQVLLNQIVLGPSVVAIVFAWNNIWLGKLSELPNKYQKDGIPTLITGKDLCLEICKLDIVNWYFIWFEFSNFCSWVGFRFGWYFLQFWHSIFVSCSGYKFWVPVSVLNFW